MKPFQATNRARSVVGNLLGSMALLLLVGSSLPASPAPAPTEPVASPILEMMHSLELHRAGYTGRGVTVAVVDTGYDHPSVPLLAWHDEVDGTKQPVDLARSSDGSWKKFGHGTMVAGCARVTAPDCDLLAIRYSGRMQGLAPAIRWVVQHRTEYHIGVLNLSITGGDSFAVQAAIQEAVAQRIVVVASMGNNGPEPDGGACPGDLAEVLTVGGASTSTTIWPSSSRGPTLAGLHKPDLCAPAEGIVTWKTSGNHFDAFSARVERERRMGDAELLATYEQSPDRYGAWSKLPADLAKRPDGAALLRAALPRWSPVDADHLLADGTSLSAPLVSGVVATLVQAVPTATPAEIREALKATAHPMDPRLGVDDVGAGFIDAHAALNFLQSRHR